MTAREKIKKFLTEPRNISIGYRELTFFTPGNFEAGQIGYSVDSNNNSLTTEKPGEWKKEWLAIGVDDMGDPLFVDTTTNKLAVLTAMHGEGEWDPMIISDSLDSFGKILAELKSLSIKRTTPVALEKKPITENEREQFVEKVKIYNPEGDIDYWRNLIGDDIF